jgi:hypothetical protein
MSALAYVLPRMLMHVSLTASPRLLPVSGAVLQGGRQVSDMFGMGGEGAVSSVAKVLCLSGVCRCGLPGAGGSLQALSAGAGKGPVLHSLSAVSGGFSTHVDSCCTRCMYCRIVACFRPGAVCLVVLLVLFIVVLFTGGACSPCASGPLWRHAWIVARRGSLVSAAGAGICACAAAVAAAAVAAGSAALVHLVVAVAVGGPARPCGMC